MENQDKIYDQFKDAARKAETKDFARMEAVWSRVEDKLDNNKQRKIAIWWKYTGLAALLLLFVGIGFIMLNNNNVVTPNATPQNNVTVIDTQAVKETFNPGKVTVKEGVVVEEMPNNTKSDNSWRSNSAPNIIKGDTIHFEPKTKKSRVWNSRNDEGEFRIVAEIVTKEPETVYPERTVRPSKANAIVVEKATEPTLITKQMPIVTTTSPIITDNKGFAVVTGTVNDSNGMPLPGAPVIIKGTTAAVTTDIDGKFSIVANAGDKLIISYIGYEQEVIDVTPAANNITIALADDVQSLEEVVVIAYGTSKRYKASERKAKREERKAAKETKLAVGVNYQLETASPTGDINFASAPNGYIKQDNKNYRDGDRQSTSVVSSETIKGKPNTSFVQSLQGQVPGLNVTTGSGAPGSQVLKGRAAGVAITPNAGVQYDTLTNGRLFNRALPNGIAIRGVGSIHSNFPEPLYIIDGKPVSARAARKLDAVNIESIEVLKGSGATAVYGNRGAYGVIMIKTKKLTRKQQRELKKVLKEDEEAGYIDSTTGKFVPMEKIKIDQEEYEAFEENNFENPATTPLSTFSIDVDNASYTNIRRFINNGEVVPKDAVRVEEMINFFKYNYPQPVDAEPFSINTEYSDTPWNPNHKLLKIGLQGKEIQQNELPASNFVFLIDVSGSMSDTNKLPLLKQSMKLLVNQMRKQDRIAIVVYAGAAGLVLPSTSGDEKAKIIAALDNLEAGGSTAGGAGIELAYKTALDNFVKKGNNRVILATDGDFNVGASSDTDMQTLIEEKRKSGVFLTCLGYGMGNYKDSKLETLADKGNGNYAYIDNMQEADRYLNKEFKGSMYAIAKDVKIQIEFNPKYVQSYRLIGYENRKLREEDFANDAIDAGELGSGHTVTALYEIIPTGVKSDYFNAAPELKYSTPQSATGNYNDELATIKFRSKKPDEEVSKEIVKVIPNIALPMQNTSGDFKFSAAVAWFGLKLRDSKLVPDKSTEAIKNLAKQGLQNDPEGYRAEFIRLVNMVE